MIRKILAVLLFLLVVPAFIAADGVLAAPAKWGTIMYVHAKTNIRAKRTINSGLKGQLQAGQAVKADLLEDDWYAIFKPSETRRSERYALGYVYAPRLFPSREGEEAAAATPKPKTDGDTVDVEVKSIRFKVTADGKEAILVEFNRFYMPAIYYVEGKAPKIVMDITNTTSIRKEWTEMKVQGTMIKRVRATAVPAGKILRIALDMDPTRNYNANPILYRSENTYAVEVSDVAGVQPTPSSPASNTPPSKAVREDQPASAPAVSTDVKK
ncbi:MAG: hypothetical protein HPY65_07620 [Syntrophaceae bacterium]|nr:hypothetical protein [Syntrophaceae bacterium]